MFDLEKLMALDIDLKKLPGFQALFVLEPFHRYHRHYTSRLMLEGNDFQYVSALCQEMIAEFEARRDGYRVICKAHFLSLIAYISRRLVPPRESVSEKYYQIAGSVRHMEDHFTEHLSLKEISGKSFLSERHFARLFQAVYRISPFEYLIRYRLERACGLLHTTRFGLGEIAVECGFGDKVSLSRHFRRVYGLTPGQFRKADQA